MEELRETLGQLCTESPDAPSAVAFESVYRMVYQLCLHQKYAGVHACLVEVVGRVRGTAHAQWHFDRFNDISLYYNNTCVHKGFPAFTTIYEDHRPAPDRFSTPPPSP